MLSRLLTPIISTLVLALLTVVPGAAAEPHDHSTHDHGPGTSSSTPAADRARGLDFTGLERGRAGGPCADGFVLPDVARADEVACTHGPDPAPDGVDVTQERTTAELAAATAAASAGETASSGQIMCLGDGTDGNRAQAVYVVASDRPDRYDEIAPLIVDWARTVDSIVADSAAKTGGVRHVRFVTDADCSLSVLHVVVPPSGDDTIQDTISAVRQLGLDSPSRKYMMWVDASRYCGIGSIYTDDNPNQDNRNNGRYAQYSRVDSGCWGSPNSLMAHELMHNLGGVQPTAPNGTSQWHCSDESDRMCYNDGTGATMRYVCSGGDERLFDCGNDDYFHTSPPANSYLATHWNTANSSFLTDGEPYTPPPADTTPPGAPSALTATAVDDRIVLDWTPPSDADVAAYNVWRDGTLRASGSNNSFRDRQVVAGETYTYTVSATDAAGNESTHSNSVTVTFGEAGDTTPPGAPQALTAAVSDGRVALAWAAPADDDVARYRVWRDGTAISTVTSVSHTDTAVVEGESYTYYVTAVDTAGNMSSPSGTQTVTIPVVVDTTAPGAPRNVAATVNDGRVDLTWAAPADEDVARYRVWRDGTVVSTTTSRSYTDGGVEEGESYTYRVTAVDTAGNESPPSDTQTVTIPVVVDTTAPGAPRNVAAAASDGRVDLSWTAPTDDDVARYRVYRDGTAVATTTSTRWSDAAVANGTTYGYHVTAIDTADNESAASAVVRATPEAPQTSGISLSADGYKERGRHRVRLTWDGATTDRVEIYRDGVRVMTTPNDGGEIHATDDRGSATYRYEVCETGGGACSAVTAAQV